MAKDTPFDRARDFVEEKIEQLCLVYEKWKPYLIERWQHEPEPAREEESAALATS